MSIEIDVRHRLGGFKLDCQFTAPPGLTALFGRSGSGKTSVIKAVAGVLTPGAGRIAVDGDVLFEAGRASLPTHRRRVGYIFQDARLFPHLTVRQNLRYGQWFRRGQGLAEMDIVELLGLGSLLARNPRTLSGGETSRVAIGRALLSDPRILLADEPLAALDEARKAEIMPYFERLRDELNIPILYVSHSASEVGRLATTVVALRDGKVECAGPADAVLADPSVTPVGIRAAGAVVVARLVAHHADGLTELDAGGIPFFVPQAGGAVGTQVRLRIVAQDVLVSVRPPEGLSALNVLPGEIETIRNGEGPGALLAVRTPAGPVLARVTQRSVAALAVEAGRPCHLIIKTVSLAPGDVG